jgi:hypothetical protein
MRNLLLSVALVAAGVSASNPVTAQADRLRWNGDSLQWSTTLDKGQTFRLQGLAGSIRASVTKDGRVYRRGNRE